MKEIIIVSLGSGDPDLLNHATQNALRDASLLFLRTERHPIIHWLREKGIPYQSFDSFYTEIGDFDQLNRAIADHLLEAASSSSPLVYAVPDPCLDQSVTSLYQSSQSGEPLLRIIPGVSTLDQMLGLVRSFIGSGDLRISTASGFPQVDYDPNLTLVLTEIDNALMAGEIKYCLNPSMADEDTLLFSPDGSSIVTIPLLALDRQKHYDHRSFLVIPARSAKNRSRFTLRDLTDLADSRPAASLPDPSYSQGAEEADEEEILSAKLANIILKASFARRTGAYDLKDLISNAYRLLEEKQPE